MNNSVLITIKGSTLNALCLFLIFNFASCQYLEKVKTKVETVKAELDKPEKSKRGINPKYIISCEGIGDVKLTDTHETLLKKFGSDVSEHENSIYGAFSSVWYQKSEQINIFWKETTPPFKTVKYLEITNMEAPYMTKDSLSLGKSLWDLIKINGFQSVKFVNLSQKDSPGLIKSFNGGTIEKNTPCIAGVLERTQMRNIHKNDYVKFMKKEEVSSSDPMLNRIDYELVALRVHAK